MARRAHRAPGTAPRAAFRRGLGAAAALLLGLAAPAAADEDLAEVVRQQGEQIRRLQAEVDHLRGQNAGTVEYEIERYLASTESEEAPPDLPRGDAFGRRVRLGGYFSLEFRDDGDTSTMEFDQHRLVLKIFADVAEGIAFDTEIEIEGGGADVDFLGGNEILVEYAELSFEIIDDRAVFVAGLILVPWGRFNQFHDDPLNEFTDRPLVSRRIGAVAFGQPGLAGQGTLEIGDGWFIDYKIALVQGFDDDFSTSGGVRDARQSFRSDNNDNKQVFGRIVIDPPVRGLDTLEFGVSFAYGKHDDGGNLTNYGYALELFVKRGRFTVIGEYMMLRIEQPVTAPLTDPRRMDGWYVEVAYRLFPARWRGRHVLFTDESAFTFVVRVEGINLNHSTRGTAFRDDLDQVSIGFNFRPVQRTVFKLSYTFVDSADPAFGGSSADRFTMSWASYF